MRSEFLFVYGTLRKNFRLHHYLDRPDVHLICTGTIAGVLYDLGEYPGALPAEDSRVYGELYELKNPDVILPELDRIEGFDPNAENASLFVRRLVPVKSDDGDIASAWVYWLRILPEDARIITSGKFY